MTSDQTISHLKKIVELSGSMLATARESDWEQLQEMEQQRQMLWMRPSLWITIMLQILLL